MDNKSDDQFLIMQATIYENRQPSDDKMNIYESKLDKLTEMIESMMVQNQNPNSSSDKMD